MQKIGFLITHGTDTMAWTFHFLRYSLKYLPCNIAIVGSQKPLQMILGASDAPQNIRSAMIALTYIAPPNILVVFNDGTSAFSDNLRKVHMWDDFAFEGEQVAWFSMDHIKYMNGDIEIFRAPRKLDLLVVIRTGGTIESIFSEEGYLVPGKPQELFLAISRYEKVVYERVDFRSISSPKDSSNMTPDDWFELADMIASILQENGYNTYVDKNFDLRVGVIWVNPLATVEDYVRMMEPYDGIIIAGYGGGNANISETKYSLLRAIRWATKKGKIVVLASQVDRGIEEPLYETGWKLVEAYVATDSGSGEIRFGDKDKPNSIPFILAIPSGDFGIAKSQIKLAYILGHREIISRIAKECGIDERKLTILAFVSGMKFVRQKIMRKFEKLLGYKIPEKDYFINTDFEQALRKLISELSPIEPRLEVIDTQEKFVEFIEKVGVPKLKEFVFVLKPDKYIGKNMWGELLDASVSLQNILAKAFKWNSVAIELRSIDPEAIPAELAIHGIGGFLRRVSKLIFVEGGRQSVYDPSSFDETLTQEKFLDIIKSLALNRTSETAPAIYICLGHQAIVEALRRILIEIMDNATSIAEDLRKIDKNLAEEFIKLIQQIHRKGSNIEVKDDMGITVAGGYRDPLFAVKKNEMPEIGIKTLAPYTPPEEIDKEIIEAYKLVSEIGSGIIEDIITIDDINVALIHSDEANEEAILFLNYAYYNIHKLINKYRQKILELTKRKETKPTTKYLTRIPIGIEILCSTKYQRQNKPLTQAAGLAIYYYDYNNQQIIRDYSLQFHPEILEDMRTAQTTITRKINIQDDGIKLLITLTYNAFAKNKMII